MTEHAHHTEIAPPPCYPHRPKWAERWFAWFLCQAEGPMEAAYGEMKDALFADLHGRVVEIGPGIGINFGHYPKGIDLIGLEPNPYLHGYLNQYAAKHGLRARFLRSVGEEMPFEDASVDAVVCTLVLCSVYEPARVLEEVRRILKPGGRFYFIEHVAAPMGTWTRWVQNRLYRPWKVLGDGCCTNRETWNTLAAAGFTAVHLEHRRIPTPFKFIDPHIHGFAVK